MINSNSYTITGTKHQTNQDSFLDFADNVINIYAVADGMGGHAAGDVASRIVIDTLKNRLAATDKDAVIQAVNLANESIIEKAKEKPEYEGMGSTLAMLCIDENHAIIAHVGDSRVYVINGGEVVFRTKDHSYVQRLVDSGEIAESEAAAHKMKNIITRAVGVTENVTPDITKIDFKDKMTVVICSDGVSNFIDNDGICKIIDEAENPALCAKALCETAKTAGSTDDLTAVVVYYEK